jgi:hypothetical protein
MHKTAEDFFHKLTIGVTGAGKTIWVVPGNVVISPCRMEHQ